MKELYKIDSKETVEIDGKDFALRIRGKNTGNPVVLFLHGGAGSPDRPFVMRYQSPLASVATLICWDQTGSGLGYDPKHSEPEDLTMESMVEDAHTLILYLLQRFRQEKIYLVGHSYGSVIGVLTAKKYPEIIAAYVGMGQVVSGELNEEISYRFVLEEAIRRGDKKTVKTLANLGAPVNGVYKDNKVMVQRNILYRYGGAVYRNRHSYARYLLTYIRPLLREYGIGGTVRYVRGLAYSVKTPFAAYKTDFLNTVFSLDVPVFLFLGHHDYNCPFSLAERWLRRLEAPEKSLVWFENSAHFPSWEEPKLWNDAIAQRVLKKSL